MDLRIEPLLTPTAHTPHRRVEPIHCAHHIKHADTFTRHPPTIPFADYLEKSNRLNSDPPFWEQQADSSRSPDSPQKQANAPHKPSSAPNIGDVSPVDKQQVTQHYHQTMRLQRTINLGSIVDVIS